uniref:Gibberellin 3-beta-dioxygenase 1-like n=1 Tax=Nicotiana tabacum TaxID=4097 RepID=A0A1S3XJG4_TOBAC|nr:PREDICTED: gibberellin 3-beta-dioxygenase 1-like [Nicotiana tabacum]
MKTVTSLQYCYRITLEAFRFFMTVAGFDVPPVSGALVVNVGDLLQLISNDKFTSIAHRVLASRVGPRVSVACFFTTGHSLSSRVYGPIKELLSEDNPARYRETTIMQQGLEANLLCQILGSEQGRNDLLVCNCQILQSVKCNSSAGLSYRNGSAMTLIFILQLKLPCKII